MAVKQETLAPITLGLPLPPRSDSDASCLLPHMVRRLPLSAPPPLPTRQMPIIPRLPINLAVDQISVFLRPEPPPHRPRRPPSWAASATSAHTAPASTTRNTFRRAHTACSDAHRPLS